MSVTENAAVATRVAIAEALAADRAAAATAEPLAMARGAVANLRARINAKHAERAAIAADRAAGNCHPDHGPLLQLNAVDLENYAPLLADAEATALQAAAAHDAAQRDLVAARLTLEQAKASERLAVALDRLALLDEATGDVVRLMAEQIPGLSQRQIFDLMGDLMAHLARQQSAMTTSVNMVANIRRNSGVQPSPWRPHPGFASVPNILHGQLSMQDG